MLLALLCPHDGSVFPRVLDCRHPQSASGPESPAPLNLMRPIALSVPPLIFFATNLFLLPTVEGSSSFSLPAPLHPLPPSLGFITW